MPGFDRIMTMMVGFWRMSFELRNEISCSRKRKNRQGIGCCGIKTLISFDNDDKGKILSSQEAPLVYQAVQQKHEKKAGKQTRKPKNEFSSFHFYFFVFEFFVWKA